METNDMKIFEKHEDYEDWKKLIQHCQILEGLTDFEKERAKRAFQWLREEFGETFLADAFESHHPIYEYIVNLVPWTRKWMTWFAEALKELKGQENYSSLLGRIKDRDKFGEGISVLGVAYKFSKAGFNISIDPSVDVSGHKKIPDLKLIDRDTKEELFVEVCVLGKSKIERNAFQTMEKVTGALWRSIPFLHYCGRINKTLSKRHLDHIVKKIEKTVEKVKREGIFQELIVDDVVEIGIAPERDKQFLEKWSAERELKVGEFCGPPFDVNHLLRTKLKIENEQKQLPHDRPTILFIRNNDLFFHLRDIRKVISELEEVVYEYPHLLAVVVAGSEIGHAENVITMKDQHVFIKRSTLNLFVEQYIILFNRFCEQKISPATITNMYNSFRSY